MFKRGFNKFIKEIEITNMLKTIRILKSNAKRNFSKIQWRIYKLQKGTRKLHLDQDFDKQIEDKVFKQHTISRRRTVRLESYRENNEENKTIELEV